MNKHTNNFLKTYNFNKNLKKYRNKIMPKGMLQFVVFDNVCAKNLALYGSHEIDFNFNLLESINYSGVFGNEKVEKQNKIYKCCRIFLENLIETYTNHIKEFISENNLLVAVCIEVNHYGNEITLTLKLKDMEDCNA